MSTDAPTLFLGRQPDGAEVSLPAHALLRHAMALGASGSGKTVLCKVLVEEVARHGVPAICVDPQGDLCSFAGGLGDEAAMRAHGLDPEAARAIADRLEVVVFTPGSERGIPLSADPIDGRIADLVRPTGSPTRVSAKPTPGTGWSEVGLGERSERQPGTEFRAGALEAGERALAISRAAAIVTGLVGVDLESDEGAGLAAVFDRALEAIVDPGSRPSLAELASHLEAAAATGFSAYARYLDPKRIERACQRLARLEVGARRRLFHDGVPIDIDVLLGRDARAPVAPGKVRLAIVYLNTLHTQEDKDFFLAALADRLYAWMLGHPSKTLSALFYIDEVAPFIPPVRKPACKEALTLLFKQARKFGVGCLMASQNPGDVDYRALSQFGTWALGRLSTRQDLKKVEPALRALAPEASGELEALLPSLGPGELVLLCPDAFDRPIPFTARWLATGHDTWDEAKIEAAMAPMRARFEALITASAEPAPPPPGPRAEAPPPEEPPTNEVVVAPDAAADEPAVEIQPEASAGDPWAEAIEEALGRVSNASVRELAEAIGASEAIVRRRVAGLEAEGVLSRFDRGRSRRYFLPSRELRPDLGMPDRVLVLAPRLDEIDVVGLGEAQKRSRWLGLVGEDEVFESASLVHRLVYRVDFEERVGRSLLARLTGPAEDERVGSVYLDGRTLSLLSFTEREGIRFVEAREQKASDIRDFDGVSDFVELAPGRLAIDDAEWLARRPEAEVVEAFERRFAAKAKAVSPIFVPLWQLYFRTEKGSLRRLTLDPLVGRPVSWPEP